MTEPPSLLIIGYGNSLRRDDGAGLLLAERLTACWLEAGMAVRLILTQQLMPELAEEIASGLATHIVFVDTRMAEGRNSAVEIESIRPEAGDRSLGHQMDPATVLWYAGKLYGRTPAASVVTIPGHDFGFGDGFTAYVQQVLADSETIARQTLAHLGIEKYQPCTG